jgi:hypothetical protein
LPRRSCRRGLDRRVGRVEPPRGRLVDADSSAMRAGSRGVGHGVVAATADVGDPSLRSRLSVHVDRLRPSLS